MPWDPFAKNTYRNTQTPSLFRNAFAQLGTVERFVDEKILWQCSVINNLVKRGAILLHVTFASAWNSTYSYKNKYTTSKNLWLISSESPLNLHDKRCVKLLLPLAINIIVGSMWHRIWFTFDFVLHYFNRISNNLSWLIHIHCWNGWYQIRAKLNHSQNLFIGG